MRRSSLSTDERGSAPLEFILGGLLLLVPLVYLVVALGLLQGHALGAEAGARHLARAVATSAGAAEADVRADAVIDAIIDEYGMDAASVDVGIACLPSAGACPDAGVTLIVTIRSRVALPLVPAVLGLDRLGSVPIEATAVQKMSRFWGSE